MELNRNIHRENLWGSISIAEKLVERSQIHFPTLNWRRDQVRGIIRFNKMIVGGRLNYSYFLAQANRVDRGELAQAPSTRTRTSSGPSTAAAQLAAVMMIPTVRPGRTLALRSSAATALGNSLPCPCSPPRLSSSSPTWMHNWLTCLRTQKCLMHQLIRLDRLWVT